MTFYFKDLLPDFNTFKTFAKETGLDVDNRKLQESYILRLLLSIYNIVSGIRALI